MELTITGELIRVVLDNPYKTEGLDYWKHVTGLDRSKIRRGGYAYLGNFISGEVDLPLGALIMEGSSVKGRWGSQHVKKYARLHRVTHAGLVPIEGPHALDDGTTSLSKHNLSFFEFVEEQLQEVVPPARVRELESFTDSEVLFELAHRGYFTISEARDLLETRREGYKPILPPPDQRCRKIKADGEQCARKAQKGLTTCWQHREQQ